MNKNQIMTWEEWGKLDATALAKLISKKHLSAKEASIQATLASERVNSKINAVIEVFEDAVMHPEKNRMNTNARFSGVPIMIKDMGSRMKGRNQEIGFPWREDYISPCDDPLIENLRDSGFNLIGRTTVPEDGMTLITHSIKHGDTRNPWNIEHTSGGSSGGSSAAVSSGIVPVCMGSDGGGSIRFPSAWTGLIGLKTTRGMIPLPFGVDESMMSPAVEGVITKSVRDCAYIYEMISVHKHIGKGFMPNPSMPSLSAELNKDKKFKIGINTGNWSRTDNVKPIILEKINVIAEHLENIGHQIELVSEDDICDFERLFECFSISDWIVPIAKELRHEVEEFNVPLNDEHTSIQLRNHIHAAKNFSLDDYLNARIDTETIMRSWGSFWTKSNCDLLLTPVTPISCPKLDSHYRMDNEDEFEVWFNRLLDAARYTIPANHTGQPAISVPAGYDSNNCPIGAQFHAPWSKENNLINIASQLENTFSGQLKMYATNHISNI